MTEPFVPANTDLRNFDYMPLKVAQLRDSDLAAVATDAEFRAAVMLWCASWHQVPASSLPNDERLLCRLAGLGRDIRTWKEIRTVALKGFVTCTDGRLYHPLIADLAIVAAQKQRRNAERTRNATEARKARNEQRDDAKEPNVTMPENERDDNVTRTIPAAKPHVTSTKGKGEGIEKGKGEEERGAAATDEWAVLEKKLRKAAGWEHESHPNLSVVGPIVELIATGSSLELDVLPVVKATASRANGRSSWKYFIPGIRDATKTRLGIRAQALSPAEEAQWVERLDFGRKNSQWGPTWGPMPGQAGCAVPWSMLKPGDGQGWTEWKQSA